MEIKTAGVPAKIQLIPDRRKIKADVKDLLFVTARVVDKYNNLVPDAGNLIKFSISGPAKIEATDNGYQADLDPITKPKRKAWKGLALVIVRPGEKKGNITLRANSDGLEPAILSLQTGE